MMTQKPPAPTLIRPYTPRQEEIADGIGRGLTYAEIAGELSRRSGQPVAEATIRSHVRTMAMLMDGFDELAPRQRIYLLVKWREWETRHPTSANMIAAAAD